MDIHAQKALIIKQFMQIDDIDLIRVIKNILDYASHKKEEDILVSDNHKQMIMDRIKMIDADPSRLLDWEEAKNRLKA